MEGKEVGVRKQDKNREEQIKKTKMLSLYLIIL